MFIVLSVISASILIVGVAGLVFSTTRCEFVVITQFRNASAQIKTRYASRFGISVEGPGLQDNVLRVNLPVKKTVTINLVRIFKCMVIVAIVLAIISLIPITSSIVILLVGGLAILANVWVLLAII